MIKVNKSLPGLHQPNLSAKEQTRRCHILLVFFLFPQTNVDLGVLVVLLADSILLSGQILFVWTGLCGLQGASRGLQGAVRRLPWPPAASLATRGLT